MKQHQQCPSRVVQEFKAIVLKEWFTHKMNSVNLMLFKISMSLFLLWKTKGSFKMEASKGAKAGWQYHEIIYTTCAQYLVFLMSLCEKQIEVLVTHKSHIQKLDESNLWTKHSDWFSTPNQPIQSFISIKLKKSQDLVNKIHLWW